MKNNLPPEIMKQFRPQAGLPQPAAPMPTAPPLAAPQVGPTLANQAAQDPLAFFENRSHGEVGLPDVFESGQARFDAPNKLVEVPQQESARGVGLLQGAADVATNIFGQRTAPLRAGIAAGTALGAGATDYLANPDRPSLGESAQVGGQAAGALPSFSAPQGSVAAPRVGYDITQPESLGTPQVGTSPAPLASQVTPDQAVPAPEAQATPTEALTTQSGIPLSQFLSGEAIPEAGLRAESTMYGVGSESRGLTGEAGRVAFSEDSLARDARQEQMLQTRAAQRAGERPEGELSMEDAVRMSGGDRDAARAMVVASRQGGGTSLTPEQQVARERLELDRAKFADSVLNREGPQKELTAAQKEFAKKSGEGAYDWDQGGRASAQENIDKFDGVINDLKTGQLDTRTLVEFAPLVGDWARSAVNPTGQQGLDTIRGVIFQGLRDTLGAQFTEREGERLVNAAYNPKLDEASNIARLEPALARMRATFDAKEALTQHIIDGGSVKDYKGQSPSDVYKSFDGGSGGSPIQGDVDIQTAADDILNTL